MDKLQRKYLWALVQHHQEGKLIEPPWDEWKSLDDEQVMWVLMNHLATNLHMLAIHFRNVLLESKDGRDKEMLDHVSVIQRRAADVGRLLFPYVEQIAEERSGTND